MKKTIPIAIALLIIAGGAFYWFEWRPSEARKECWISATENPIKPDLETETQRRSRLDWIYKNCLKGNGLSN